MPELDPSIQIDVPTGISVSAKLIIGDIDKDKPTEGSRVAFFRFTEWMTFMGLTGASSFDVSWHDRKRKQDASYGIGCDTKGALLYLSGVDGNSLSITTFEDRNMKLQPAEGEFRVPNVWSMSADLTFGVSIYTHMTKYEGRAGTIPVTVFSAENVGNFSVNTQAEGWDGRLETAQLVPRLIDLDSVH